MTRIAQLDARGELKKNLAAKQWRFVAVRGVGTEVPGVADGIANPLVMKYGYNVIVGTSDVIQNQRQGRLDDKARRYATTYNKLLLDYLRQH